VKIIPKRSSKCDGASKSWRVPCRCSIGKTKDGYRDDRARRKAAEERGCSKNV
jgi:hypothetical protein